jgi:hypothetical protein
MSETSDAPTTPLPAVPAAPAPVLRSGTPASCRACSAPLAADQRYCLNCGARVAAARVEWPAVAAHVAGTPGGRPAAPPRGDGPRRGSLAGLLERVGGPMGAAAVVLVALGVGFLLGQSGEEASGPATVIQRPPVINVQGGGGAAAGGAAEDAGALDAGATSARGRAGRGAAGGSGSTEGVATATPDDAGGDLDRLQQQPTEQATEGPPPSRDDRPSGGGTEAETIG